MSVQNFSFTLDEPLGGNPFPAGDKRHGRWSAVSRLAKEHLATHRSTMLGRMPPDDAAIDKYQAWMVDRFAGEFGIRAGALLAEFGTTYENIAKLEKTVDHFAESYLAEAKKIDHSQSRIVTGTFLSELQIRLTQCREHGIGEAYKWVREAEFRQADRLAENQAAGGAAPPVEDQRDSGKRPMQTEAGTVSKPSTGWAVCPSIELGGTSKKPKIFRTKFDATCWLKRPLPEPSAQEIAQQFGLKAEDIIKSRKEKKARYRLCKKMLDHGILSAAAFPSDLSPSTPDSQGFQKPVPISLPTEESGPAGKPLVCVPAAGGNREVGTRIRL